MDAFDETRDLVDTSAWAALAARVAGSADPLAVLRDDQVVRWSAGQRVPAEDYLRRFPALVPDDALVLITGEVGLRRERGESPPLSEYQARFPQFASDLVAQFELLSSPTAGTGGPPDLTGSFSAAPGSAREPIPATVGGFRVLRRLGSGGMGVVYLADDPLGRRQVAVKVMRLRYATDPSARDRFLREARSAMAVEHDHVVPVYQVGIDGASPFLVMPVLKGESLEDRLGREPLSPPELVLKVGREVALGLAAAHERGLVHRDVKPANTWLESEPAAPGPGARVRRVKVLDFGLARATDGADRASSAGAVVGTPAYMAPEQARGEKVDGRADLFGLGAVLYRMATGQPAFAGSTLTAVLTAVATHHPPPPISLNPAVPPALSALIERLLEKEPGDRPASARGVADELASLGEGRQQPAAPLPRRGKWAAAVGVAALVLAGVWAWLAARPPGPTGSGADGDGPSPSAPLPVESVNYSGSVDLLVHRKDLDGSDVAYPLWDVRAWPLRPGDEVKVAAEVVPAAYVYLFWIDETGGTHPLYPWTPLRWGTRPAAEQKASRLEVKDPNGNWFKISGTAAGMETIQMLARAEPLRATDGEVREWFRDLRPLAFGGEKARSWFQGFDLVRHDPTRAPEYGGEMGREEGPLGQQAVLGRRIGDRAGFSRAVTFARLGRTEGK